MSVLLLGSVSGSPGVTTTAVALALAWPRPVILVEAAAVGASAVLPGYLRGAVPHQHGIVDAAVAARAGTLTQDLPGLLMALPESADARLLAGLVRPEQTATMAAAWPVLADALVDAARAHDLDLIIDGGRFGSPGSPLALAPLADTVLLATCSDLPSLHAVRAWLPQLRGLLVDPSRLSLLVIGEGDPYTAREIRRHLATPVRGIIDRDPEGAAVWSHGRATPRRPGAFTRSLAVLLPTLAPRDLDVVGGEPA